MNFSISHSLDKLTYRHYHLYITFCQQKLFWRLDIKIDQRSLYLYLLSFEISLYECLCLFISVVKRNRCTVSCSLINTTPNILNVALQNSDNAKDIIVALGVLTLASADCYLSLYVGLFKWMKLAFYWIERIFKLILYTNEMICYDEENIHLRCCKQVGN